MKKKILVFQGSLRDKSSNRLIINHIKSYYIKDFNFDIYTKSGSLPIFNPDLDQATPPSLILELRKKIKNADGILICSPEYVFSMPANLKNILEWNVSNTFLSQKPLAIIVAAASGEKALESIDLVTKTLEMKSTKKTKLLIKGLKGKVVEGKISDKKILDKIDLLMEELERIIENTTN